MALPGLNGNIVLGGTMISVLRQALAVAAHVSARKVEDADTKAFNASNLPLNIGNRGHSVSWIIA